MEVQRWCLKCCRIYCTQTKVATTKSHFTPTKRTAHSFGTNIDNSWISITSGGSRISPRGGANSPGGRQDTILQNFPKNCMKLKEFGLPGEGARVPRAPLDPPLITKNKCSFGLKFSNWYTKGMMFVKILSKSKGRKHIIPKQTFLRNSVQPIGN